jgi:hypothetical protein
MQRLLWPASPLARIAQATCWSRRDLLGRSQNWVRPVPRALRWALVSSAEELVRQGTPLASWATLGVIPGLRAFARELHEELVLGSGVAYLTGLVGDGRDLSDQVMRWVYLLIGAQIGDPLGSNGSLVEITGRCQTSVAPEVALADASPETRFHTDSFGSDLPDVVGTLCLRSAPIGGEYQIVSAALAHEILKTRCGTDLLGELYEPFIRDHSPPGTEESDASEESTAAVFSTDGHRLLFNYTRPGIEAAYRRVGQPLSARQRDGFDRLDEALGAPMACLQLQMRRGDILFVNNWHIAHNRRPFVDDADPYRRRRMVRMWLALDPPDPYL